MPAKAKRKKSHPSPSDLARAKARSQGFKSARIHILRPAVKAAKELEAKVFVHHFEEVAAI